MYLSVTAERHSSPSGSSDVETTTTPAEYPISPRSPIRENLTFEAPADEDIAAAPIYDRPHNHIMPSPPRTPSRSPEPTSSGTVTPKSTNSVRQNNDDPMEGVELDQPREEESDANTFLSVEDQLQEELTQQDDNESIISVDFRYEWLGTSQLSVDGCIALQEKDELETLIWHRAQVLLESEIHPYDPTPLLTLAYLDNRLGFSDIAAANSCRALLLINAAFNLKVLTTPSNLGKLAQKAVSLRLNTFSITIVGDELLALRLQAYTTMINGLAGCASFWDGLKQCKLALKLYPGDHKLLQLKAELEDGFEMCNNSLGNLDKQARDIFLKTGKLYQRPYPWLDSKLFNRTKKLIREVNKELSLHCGHLEEGRTLEVRRAFFGPNAESDSKIDIPEGEDVGSLGLFATRDIGKEELIMVDKSMLGVSQIPSSNLQSCDACQACLSLPYLEPSQIIKPLCCKDVAYCSRLCYEAAMRSYHPLLCGRNFTWLYKNVKLEGQHTIRRRWRAICFLRIMAILITSNSKLPVAQKIHPLAHPLVARMTAAYTPETLRPKTLCEWQLLEEVTIPTRILMVLGVDIFGNPFYSQEVIQTIFWRCENNANETSSNSEPGFPKFNLFTVNSSYLFFNHSCIPNVSWNGPPDGAARLDRGVENEFLRPGESAVWCKATRNIKKGEQCTISYIGNPVGNAAIGETREEKRAMLSKWCENGCGCEICEKENGNGGLAQEASEIQMELVAGVAAGASNEGIEAEALN